jgi:aldehyde:ferredoxin oxidoreductase
MSQFIKKHAATFAVAAVASMVFGGVPAFAHFNSISAHDLNHLDRDYTKTAYRVGPTTAVAAGASNFSAVACPSGNWVVMGGGAYTVSTDVVVESSFPTQRATGNRGFNGWGAWVSNLTGAASNFRTYAICRRAFVNPSSNYTAGSPPVRAGLDARS